MFQRYNIGGTDMAKITKEQYEFALARIEELLPMVDDNTPANDRNAVELTMMSDVVIDYEKEHYPIGKPTVAQLIQLSLDEKNMSQKQLATEIGVSPSRISDYVSGRAEPTLKIARLLCENSPFALFHLGNNASSYVGILSNRKPKGKEIIKIQRQCQNMYFTLLL